ncbi:MAG TPA: LTA synthase family protein, partial [Verrucomicrobiae bacterium]|nr:LTA synthase family protein [Verrucomicrobiae bacterium]
YLAMNFCFRPPFLALWVLGYAAVYYWMFRSGKEHLILRVTAVFAPVYLALCLDNLWYRGILVVVDCIGITTLLGAWNAKHRLSFFFPVTLLAFMAFFFVLFFGYDGMLTWRWMNQEFFVLLAGSLVLFGGMTVLAWRRGFSIGWSWILPLAFTAFLMFANTHYSQAHNYSNFFSAGLTLPRYFLSELGIVAMWLGVALVYRRMRPGASLLWLDIVLWIIIVIGLLDLRLAQVMAARLDWQLLSLAFGETPKMMWRMARPYLPSLAVVIVILVAVYAGLLAAMRRVSQKYIEGGVIDEGGKSWLSHSRFANARWLLLGFVLLGLAGFGLMQNDKARGQPLTLLVTTSPVWQHAETPTMDEQKFNAMARELGIWQSPEKARQTADIKASEAFGSARDMNLVVIFQESTYNRFLSLFNGTNVTEPLLSKYKDRMELFPNFYSSFASSINARFASFTGLYPVADFNAFTTHHVPVKSLFEVLHEHGYSNSLFYSSYFDYTDFRDFLRGRGIEEMYDADTMPGKPVAAVAWGLREDETLTAITNKIKEYATTGKKFCLTYVPAAPHNPFDGTPSRFKKFSRGEVDDYTGPYLNEMLFMDSIVTSVVDQLKDSGLLDKTLIVITGDHGEMLGENHTAAGHGWAFTPELGNVPLIVLNPNRRGYRLNYTLGSQVDMLPTVLDVMGIPLPTDQLYQGTSLYSASADPRRTIYLNTFQEYGIFQSGFLFCGNRERPTDCYTFTNDEARTIFKVVDGSRDVGSTPTIGPFNLFQENFLRNYSDYCRMARQSTAVR